MQSNAYTEFVFGDTKRTVTASQGKLGNDSLAR